MSKHSSQTPGRVAVPASVVFAVFLKLGLTSFGGPLAHLGYFRRGLVEQRGWIDEAEFAELVALCHFLPGPSSSQTGFAIGLRKAGLAGGLAAFLGFTLPSATLMTAAAFGVALLSGPALPAIVHGLNLVAVAIVAQAVVVMARANLKSLPGIVLALLALVVCLTGSAYAAPGAILIAAVAGLIVPPADSAPAPAATPVPVRLTVPIIVLAVFAALLLILPMLRQLTGEPILATADGFYRTGALVFGGGHVVLPLIEAETAGHISHGDFLAGYGAAQALPGPLFSFAAYAGALDSANAPELLLGLAALVAIFLPGFLLVGAVAPVWASLRANRRAARMVGFAGASVVGVLAAAWWSPVVITAIRSPFDAQIAFLGFVLLMHKRVPMLAAVGFIAVLGAIFQVLT